MKTFETLREKLDIQDILSFDIPILIDDLELAQEDIEDDTEIHRIVERLIEIQKRGTLTIEDCDFIIDIEENLQIDEASPAWQRKEGKNPSGGLNKKGVASYRRQNPGSKLKTAVTTAPSKLSPGGKAAKRRKSFCARMKGMKARLTSAATARDPDSRINKSLRKWNCK
jgi:hypothetical protein